jgi:N-acetylneuraminate synthase
MAVGRIFKGSEKMAKLQFRNGRYIGDGYQPYIVAELNSSHNGKVETAMKMIDSAVECGCDCVKFQSWSAESLYSEEYYKDNPISKRIVTKFSLNEEQMKELALYCIQKGVDFSSTPYSKSEVDFLVEQTSSPFIKIASMEINNLPFLKYIAETGMPMVLSTGMASLEEIKEAVAAIKRTGNTKLCILHCVSVYPADAAVINLNNIKLLQQTFPAYPIGYSDHTVGCEVAAAAVAMGSALIEKHFTLDNKRMGMDNNMATEPVEMTQLVGSCHRVFNALGSAERIILPEEAEQKIKMRRSLVAASNIVAGQIINQDDIEAKRPGDGLSPIEAESIIGKEACVDIPKGYKLKREYFK